MALWCLLFPPKKQTKIVFRRKLNDFRSFFGGNWIIFVRFSEEIKDTKNHFKINWPLTVPLGFEKRKVHRACLEKFVLTFLTSFESISFHYLNFKLMEMRDLLLYFKITFEIRCSFVDFSLKSEVKLELDCQFDTCDLFWLFSRQLYSGECILT